MISGIKKEYPKANKSVLQKAQYEQKVQVQILEVTLKIKDLSSIFLNFKIANYLNKKKYVVAVSGGSDSLALASIGKILSISQKN